MVLRWFKFKKPLLWNDEWTGKPTEIKNMSTTSFWNCFIRFHRESFCNILQRTRTKRAQSSCIFIRPYRSTIALMRPFWRQMRRAKWGSSSGFASSQRGCGGQDSAAPAWRLKVHSTLQLRIESALLLNSERLLEEPAHIIHIAGPISIG